MFMLMALELAMVGPQAAAVAAEVAAAEELAFEGLTGVFLDEKNVCYL